MLIQALGEDRGDDDLATAVTESSLLNNVAAAAASAYGGRGGAAAYAARYTYKQTRDLRLALRAGVTAGVASKGLKMVDGMPSGTVGQLTRRTLASASVGGAAVAAAGGRERDVLEAFAKGAAYSLARENYRDMTDKQIDLRGPYERRLSETGS